ncbi:DUF3617 family protein [Sphingomonas piscis]|uniref:DUF3617 family protein n=1 Tax=Sphingomonas piscis TaxID=2714943 RepID=A0A6G7YQM5_9SPHN|nr:DUF3617 family protein [Sphingomonas piscis]QIK79036.1 DUF3617 family protein [Sphingomonas piscis]
MRSFLGTAAAALMLSACGGDATEANNTADAAPTSLQAGEYEISARVDDLRSTDKTTPSTKLEVGGAPAVTRACIGPDNAIPPAALGEAGDSCTARETYIRNGRLNLQLMCKRPGKGDITHAVDGQFKADSFDAQVISGTSFSGTGDYAMTRSITAKRVGDCAAKGA